MEAKFLSDLKKAVAENAESGVLKISDKAVPLTVEPRKTVGVSTDFTLNFDAAGNAQKGLSQWCPVNVDFTGVINGLNATFTIIIDTNYPQHLRWDNVAAGQSVGGTLKTNVFSSTDGILSVHSTVPNASASMHLDCTL
ncbi:MAG: hypothetical protein LBL31_04675 [Spirochaetaceae bacterium]|jgi:hypothetical protein|nr:hypothetical protein [Spirochaetaceae bacterium]